MRSAERGQREGTRNVKDDQTEEKEMMETFEQMRMAKGIVQDLKHLKEDETSFSED